MKHGLVPLVQAPAAGRRVAHRHVHHDNRPAVALLDGGLEGCHVGFIRVRHGVLVLIHRKAIDPYARVVRCVSQVLLYSTYELGEAAFPRVRHEVRRQANLRQVHQRPAVRKAIRARHFGELHPLMHDIARRELLVVGDWLVGDRSESSVDMFEATHRHFVLDLGLDAKELPQRNAFCRRSRKLTLPFQLEVPLDFLSFLEHCRFYDFFQLGGFNRKSKRPQVAFLHYSLEGLGRQRRNQGLGFQKHRFLDVGFLFRNLRYESELLQVALIHGLLQSLGRQH